MVRCGPLGSVVVRCGLTLRQLWSMVFDDGYAIAVNNRHQKLFYSPWRAVMIANHVLLVLTMVQCS